MVNLGPCKKSCGADSFSLSLPWREKQECSPSLKLWQAQRSLGEDRKVGRRERSLTNPLPETAQRADHCSLHNESITIRPSGGRTPPAHGGQQLFVQSLHVVQQALLGEPPQRERLADLSHLGRFVPVQ